MPNQHFRELIIEIYRMILLLLTAIPPPTPYSSHTEMTTDAMIRLALPFLLLLVTFQIPPPANPVPIMQRLDLDFHGHNFEGRDIFQTIENQRYLFWLSTGGLPETMLDIAAKISRNLNRITTRGGERRKVGSSKLSNLNKVLHSFGLENTHA